MALPSIKSSLSTRIAYLSIFISGVITSSILMAPAVREALGKVCIFVHSFHLIDTLNYDSNLSFNRILIKF